MASGFWRRSVRRPTKSTASSRPLPCCSFSRVAARRQQHRESGPPNSSFRRSYCSHSGRRGSSVEGRFSEQVTAKRAASADGGHGGAQEPVLGRSPFIKGCRCLTKSDPMTLPPPPGSTRAKTRRSLWPTHLEQKLRNRTMTSARTLWVRRTPCNVRAQKTSSRWRARCYLL